MEELVEMRRIVEKSGQTVRDLIGTGYPWNYEKCDKEDCFLCSTSVKTNVSCQKQGMGYRILCTLCENNGVVCEYEAYMQEDRNISVSSGGKFQQTV